MLEHTLRITGIAQDTRWGARRPDRDCTLITASKQDMNLLLTKRISHFVIEQSTALSVHNLLRYSKYTPLISPFLCQTKRENYV